METNEKDKKDKELDINEVAMTLEVDAEVIEKVRTGEVTHITTVLNDDNQNQILENADGALLLTIEELPDTYHGCYLYNGGEFPYSIKGSLEYLVLNDDEGQSLTKIIGVGMEPVKRFRFQGPDEPSVEDPEGDSCIWEIQFEVAPVLEEPRHYLMRWNPSVSSFKEEDYQACLENMNHGMFRLNWSISEWQEARRGDVFYMLRSGDEKAGIVFSGMFISDPYPADDWAGTTKRRMYVDMVCMNAAAPDEEPFIPLEKLQKAIPAFEWAKGHSGVLLPDSVWQQLSELWEY